MGEMVKENEWKMIDKKESYEFWKKKSVFERNGIFWCEIEILIEKFSNIYDGEEDCDIIEECWITEYERIFTQKGILIG